jgi:hypothetical protein
MLDHKPGMGTHTHGHAAAGPEPHAGKQSRVEQELGAQGHAGPIATAADTTVSSTFSTDYASFHQGNVLVSESVSATLSHGKGPVKIDLDKGGMSVGNEHTTSTSSPPTRPPASTSTSAARAPRSSRAIRPTLARRSRTATPGSMTPRRGQSRALATTRGA